jgi:carbohydrate esterase family 8
MKYIATLLLALFMSVSLSAQEVSDTIVVFMIGDSTMANKPLKDENQERGWGQMLPLMLQGPIKVDNHAVNGRSSKSFIDQGRWDAVVSKIKPGDYVIIQFGHNDEKPKADRHTDPGSTFDDNLRKFVNETRAKGGYPILCNSIVRRNFPADTTVRHVDRDDKPLEGFSNLKLAPEGDLLVDTHKEYVNAPRNVARELGVPFLEMNTLTHNLVQNLGREESKKLFMWIPEGKYAFCPKGKVDNTHLNVYGGQVVAALAARAMADAVPALSPYIKSNVLLGDIEFVTF